MVYAMTKRKKGAKGHRQPRPPKPPPKPPKLPTNNLTPNPPDPKNPLKTFLSWAYLAVTFGLSLVGGMALLPRINVTPLQSIREHDPLGTIFVLTNSGSLSVNEATAYCGMAHVWDSKYPKGGFRDSWLVDAYPDLGDVEPGQSTSIPCETLVAAANNLVSLEGTVDITIEYRPSFWP